MNLRLVALSLGLIAATVPLAAQTPTAREIVQAAVQAEAAAVKSDTSLWSYRDEHKEQNDTVQLVVQTTQGEVKRTIAKGGHPLTQGEMNAAALAAQNFAQDPAAQRKQRRDSANDDKQAAELLDLLPKAFLWSVQSETPELITLSYKPDPSFHPPDMESRVMGAMTGELVVDRAQHRIRTIRGQLEQDVTIGWGVLGRLQSGGTFDVERRQVAHGKWQITATTVHINGHALFFKSISEQQDEIRSDFVEVPRATTTSQATAMLQDMISKSH